MYEKLFHWIGSFVLFGLILAKSAQAQVIVQDDFEGGQWKSFWGSKTRASVSSERPRDGRYSARFAFQAAAPGDDSFSELRFDLGGEYRELTIEFDLFVPSNYRHRPDSPDNNKFFRLWLHDYDDVEKIGASLRSQGTTGNSRIGTDYRKEANLGMSTTLKSANDFITAADKGKWMKVSIYIKSATNTSNGIIRIFKNGRLFLDDSGIKNHVAGTQGYRYGYLLGWANSGFAEETIFYIDNVRFLASESVNSAPRPPVQLTVH